MWLALVCLWKLSLCVSKPSIPEIDFGPFLRKEGYDFLTQNKNVAHLSSPLVHPQA